MYPAARCADKRMPDGFIRSFGGQHSPRHHRARRADARIVRINGIAHLGNAVCIEPNVGQQPAVGHRQEGRPVPGLGMDDENVIFVFRYPVLVVGEQDMPVGGPLLVDRHAGAACQVQGIHGHCFHGVDHHQVLETDICALGDAHQLIHVLRVALLGKRQVFASLDLRACPGQLELLVGICHQVAPVLDAVLDLFFTGFSNLTAHLPVCAGNAYQRGWIRVQWGLDLWAITCHNGSLFLPCGWAPGIISLPPENTSLARNPSL